MTFVGGTSAGLLLDISDRETLGISMAIIAAIWLLWTFKLQNPTKHSHLFINHDDIDEAKLNDLEHEHIAEWYINETENKVIIKYVTDAIKEDELTAKILK